MSVMIRIPAPLRKLTDGQDKVSGEGGTVGQVVSYLDE